MFPNIHDKLCLTSVGHYKKWSKVFIFLLFSLILVSFTSLYISKSLLPLIMAQNQTFQPLSLSNITTMDDAFGISEIHPTKENGREWYMNMSRPENDSPI